MEKDSLTVPLGGFMMQRFRVVEINTNVSDFVDMFNKWRLCHTATTSLKAKLAEYPQLSEEDMPLVSRRTDRLLKHIEAKPKSFKWMMRAKIGTKTMWYDPVDDW